MTTGALELVQTSSNQLWVHMKSGKSCWVNQIHGHPFIHAHQYLRYCAQNFLQVYLMHPSWTVGVT
jgi:hypothetical protein